MENKRKKTDYPGVYRVSPDGYSEDEKYGTVVPHHWEDGSPGNLRTDSDSYKKVAGDKNKLESFVANAVGGTVLQKKEDKKELIEAPVVRKSRRKKSSLVETTTVSASWEIPGVGVISSTYNSVIFGDGCIVLGVGSGVQAFVPADYRNNANDVYTITTGNFTGKVLYSGLHFKDNGVDFYVLIGG